MRSSPGSFHHEYECCVSFAKLGWGLCALHAASWPEALSMGGWVPRSLHHLECARHVCNGPSHASLQTVFSLRKLHKDLDGGNGLTNTLPQFPIGRLAFSQTDAQAACTGWRTREPTHTHTRTHTHKTRAHALKGKQTGRVCLQFLSTVWHLSTLESGWQSL